MTLRPALLATMLLILAAPLTAADGVPVPVEVPLGNGSPVITDGTFVQGEWEDALRIPLNDQVSLHLKTDGGVVFVGIRGHEPLTVGPSELFVARPGGPVTRLHVSAQLYEADVPSEGSAAAPRFGWTPNWYASQIRFDDALSKKLISGHLGKPDRHRRRSRARDRGRQVGHDPAAEVHGRPVVTSG